MQVLSSEHANRESTRTGRVGKACGQGCGVLLDAVCSIEEGERRAHTRTSEIDKVGRARWFKLTANRSELVREVLATGVGGVEVAFNGHTNAATNDAVTVTPAKAGLHARDTLVCAKQTLASAKVV